MNERDYIGLRTEMPKIAQMIMPRDEIAKIIDNSSLDDLIYLVAPYGCGKTMSIVSWLNERSKKTAWLSLGNDEYTTSSFWIELSIAILKCANKADKAEELLQNASSIENPRSYLKEMLIDISPTINDKVLIIDNFKFVGSSELQRDIKGLITNMLGCWRIIFISRYEAPPLFNDFVLKKRFRLITLNELKFSFEETSRYFSINGIDVKDNDITQICKDTDGWAAAFNAIMNIRHEGSVSFNNKAKSYVKGFFKAEVWELIPNRKIEEFLIKTSILEQLTPSICYYVSEIEKTEWILRYLYANGIFITKLDEPDSYCYHLVFRDFLRDKLEQSCIDVNSLYLKAGWWLYERNESIQSLLYFYKANNLHGIN